MGGTPVSLNSANNFPITPNTNATRPLANTASAPATVCVAASSAARQAELLSSEGGSLLQPQLLLLLSPIVRAIA
jgi:hypothetical protein